MHRSLTLPSLIRIPVDLLDCLDDLHAFFLPEDPQRTVIFADREGRVEHSLGLMS
jgi:hypothetical protein